MLFIYQLEEARKVRGCDGVLGLFKVSKKLVLGKIAGKLGVDGNKCWPDLAYILFAKLVLRQYFL